MMLRKLVLPTLLVLAMPGLATAWHQPPPPSGLVSVPGVGTFWPYTDRNFSREATDPISLVFRGEDTDPRLIRQILMGLSPNPVLGCTWKDAIGRPQTTYSQNARWQGSAIQLECGEYSTLRLHLRLFRHGRYTLGGAHLEVQIPGTTQHVVLSWIGARELVLGDLYRSGQFFEPPVPVPGITAAGSWRTIDKDVYNLLVPHLPLDPASLGLPPPPVAAAVPIPNDSVVQVVTLWGQFDPVDDDIVVEFDHPFGQRIPKPFCSSGEYVDVAGPVHMVHRVKTDANGRYFSSFYASGTLVVDPYFPPGDPYPATVFEVYRSYMSDWSQTAFMEAKQVLHTDPVQWTFEALWAGPWNVYLGQESCGY